MLGLHPAGFGSIRYRHGCTITVFAHSATRRTFMMLDRRDLLRNAGGTILLNLYSDDCLGRQLSFKGFVHSRFQDGIQCT